MGIEKRQETEERGEKRVDKCSKGEGERKEERREVRG